MSSPGTLRRLRVQLPDPRRRPAVAQVVGQLAGAVDARG